MYPQKKTGLKAAFIAGFALFSTAVHASPQLCAALIRERDGVRNNRSLQAELDDYKRAISEQGREIVLAERDWHDAGCGDPSGTTLSGFCYDLEDTLSRMKSNWETMVHERLDLERQTNVDLARLDHEIRQARCNQPAPPTAPQPKEAVAPKPPVAAQTRFRTVCVRTCDGYFFPMSYGLDRSDFAREAKACQAECPTTEMRLYYYRVPDENISQMISADGDKPYSALPNANLFRQQGISSSATCGCVARPDNVPAVAEPLQSTPAPSPAPQSETPPKTAVIKPEKPAQSTEKPEKKPPLNAARPPEPGPARAMTDQEKRVRVVGPTFLPPQKEAKDQPVPDRKSGP